MLWCLALGQTDLESPRWQTRREAVLLLQDRTVLSTRQAARAWKGNDHAGRPACAWLAWTYLLCTSGTHARQRNEGSRRRHLLKP
jgi:hypothetical protein